MTVGIAAICDENNAGGKKIVFSADRQISAGIQFEGGMPKYQKFTDNCFIMDSTSDSLLSDLIIKNTKDRINDTQFMEVDKIVDILCEECEKMKIEHASKDLLWKYKTLPIDLQKDQKELLPYINNELQAYIYELQCEFLVFGIETQNVAHIYHIDQDGKRKLLDNLAFATIGNGGSLASLEITKYPYTRETVAVEAIARVHFAKRLAERALYVGHDMDLVILYFREEGEEEKKELIPTILDITTARPDIIEALDNAFTDVTQYEREKVREIMPNKLYELLIGKKNTEEQKQEENTAQKTN